MRRRTLLRTTGVALSGALAGCTGGDGDGEKPTFSATDTPASTETAELPPVTRSIRALWTAYNNENAEDVTETFHPESPSDISAANITFSGTVTVESVTVTDRSPDTAIADADITVTDGTETVSENHTYELRRHEGTWLIWAFTTGEAATTETTERTATSGRSDT